MGTLTDKVQALLEEHFDEAEVTLDAAAGDRVGGALVWNGFEVESQLQRQERLWELLRERLDSAELLRIGLIMTLTQDEQVSLASE